MINKEFEMVVKKTNPINHTVYIEKYGSPFVKEIVVIIIAGQTHERFMINFPCNGLFLRFELNFRSTSYI